MSDRLTASVYSTLNAEQFARLLTNDPGEPAIDVAHQRFLLPMAGLAAEAPPPADVCVVLSSAETALPSIARLCAGTRVERAQLDADVDAYVRGVRELAGGARVPIVATWLAPYRFSGGVLALDDGWGLDAAVARANRRAIRGLREAGCQVLNAGAWLRVLGERAFSAKGWYLAKDPYTFDLWTLAVADVKSALAALAGRSKKLLILDLDNTLWGGEVGDAGVEGLRLGGHDAAGEAYRDFQREVRALGRRGVVLAVASKNDESVALAAVDGHPEMILRREDFAGWRINWDEKAGNIVDLCAELELSLADAVFVDDNPAERRAVAAALPELMVPEWPGNPMLFVGALRRLNVFDVAQVTSEDLMRSRSYAARRARSERPAGAADAGVRVEIAPLAAVDVTRALQLLNKTNQMNLATRRFSEGELRALLASVESGVWSVRTSDPFADYGVTGAFALRFSSPECALTDFAMSCRVMSRGVEERMLERAIAEAAAHGCERLVARFVRTDRNEPMRRFLAERSGLEAQDGDRYVARCNSPAPLARG